MNVGIWLGLVILCLVVSAITHIPLTEMLLVTILAVVVDLEINKHK